MSGAPTYSRACVNKPAEASRFLSRHLNFFNFQNGLPGARDQGVLIGNKFGNNYLLCPPVEGLNEPIVINTDNCLRDFHQLKNAGIQFEKTPKYTTNGLEAIIADNYGNRYALVEKRDYSD